MTAKVGRQIRFFWGGNSPGDEIQGVQQKSVQLNGAAIDVTSDDSNGWRELLTVAATNQVSISISGVTKDTRLITDWAAGNRTQQARFEYPDGSSVSGVFYLESYTDTGPYNNAATFQAALLSSGVITYTPGS